MSDTEIVTVITGQRDYEFTADGWTVGDDGTTLNVITRSMDGRDVTVVASFARGTWIGVYDADAGTADARRAAGRRDPVLTG